MLGNGKLHRILFQIYFWYYLKCAHRKFCQYHVTLNSLLPLCWVLLPEWGHWPFHGCNYFSFLCSATPVMHWSCLDWITLLLADTTVLASTQLPLDPWTYWVNGYNCYYCMCSFKEHCQCFTWSIVVDWLIDGKLLPLPTLYTLHIFS